MIDGELRMRITSSLGCTVQLIKGTLGDEEGGMLTLDMKQPGDERHAEVWLNERDLLTLGVTIRDWDLPQSWVNTGVLW